MRVPEALVLSLVLLFFVPKPTEPFIVGLVIAAELIGGAILGTVVFEIWESFKDPDPLKITDNFIALNQKLENAEKSVSLINYIIIILWLVLL